MIETFPGKEGLIRRVRLHLGEGKELDRPIHKLILQTAPHSTDGKTDQVFLGCCTGLDYLCVRQARLYLRLILTGFNMPCT